MKYPIETNLKFFHQLSELSPVLLIFIFSYKFGRLFIYGIPWGNLFTDWQSEIFSLLPLFICVYILMLASFFILKKYMSTSKPQFLFTLFFSISSVSVLSPQLACMFAAFLYCVAIVFLLFIVYTIKDTEHHFYSMIINLLIYIFSIFLISNFNKFIIGIIGIIGSIFDIQIIYLIELIEKILSSFIFSATCISLIIYFYLFAHIKDENILNYEVKLETPDYLKKLVFNLKNPIQTIIKLIVIISIFFFMLGYLTTCTNRQYLVTQDTENINSGDYIATTVVVAESKDYYCVQSGIIRINENNNPTLLISSKSFRWIPKVNIDVYNGTFASVAIE